MSIKRRNPNPAKDLKLGQTLKTVISETLQSAEQIAGTVTDTLVTTRSAVELMHNAIEEALVESRVDVGLAVQAGLKRLMEAGMTNAQAREFLQCEAVPVKVSSPNTGYQVKHQEEVNTPKEPKSKFPNADQQGSGE